MEGPGVMEHTKDRAWLPETLDVKEKRQEHAHDAAECRGVDGEMESEVVPFPKQAGEAKDIGAERTPCIRE